MRPRRATWESQIGLYRRRPGRRQDLLSPSTQAQGAAAKGFSWEEERASNSGVSVRPRPGGSRRCSSYSPRRPGSRSPEGGQRGALSLPAYKAGAPRQSVFPNGARTERARRERTRSPVVPGRGRERLARLLETLRGGGGGGQLHRTPSGRRVTRKLTSQSCCRGDSRAAESLEA